MFEHATLAPSDTDTVTGPSHRVIPSDLALPPPALLWEWLSYIYQTTGEWWRPPVKPANPTAKPLSNAPKPGAPFSIKDFQNYSRQTPIFPEKSSKSPSITNTVTRTGFDYRASRYFEEAVRLIGQAAGLENESDCRLVLSFIIAWSRFPLFENLPANGANWMALSFGRGACELKMRASKFKTCLDELEKAGLVRLAGLSEGLLSASDLDELQTRRTNLTGEAAKFWNAHFFQKHTTLYLLAVTPDASLPTFNPFVETLAATGKTSEVVLNTSTKPARLAGSFPFDSCKNESNKNNDDDDEIDNLKANEAGVSEIAGTVGEFNKPDKLNSLLERLNIQEQSIYEFITAEAHFEGYSRLEDKRETLDPREALKFATSGRYTLEQVRTRYEQVREVWVSRSGCHNPLALLHWTLTQDIDPRRSNSKNYKQTTNSPAFSKPVNGRTAYEIARGTAKNYARPQLSFQKRMFPHTQPDLSSPAGEAIDFNQSSPAIFAQPAETREPEKLWKVICEDLAGRFQLNPLKQALLKDSALHFKTDDNSRVEIVLRSIWEERQLDGLTRNVINLALRQRLGPGLEVTFLSA